MAEVEQPSGSLDATASWSASWAVRVIDQRKGHRGLSQEGRLDLSVDRSGPEVTLTARSQARMQPAQTWVQEATIVCEDDLPLTLKRWTLHSQLLARNGSVVRLEDERSQEHDTGPGARRKGLLWSCDWAVIDAVQRLGDDAKVEFAMLQALDVPRTAVRLAPDGEATMTLKTGETTLRGWRLSGVGLVPSWYWRGPSGHVLAATAGQWALVRLP